MLDVFVSYARSTEPEAKQVANALRANGHSVWLDEELPAHRAYSEVIEERLSSAKAVVVLWSADAAKSQWVRAEADAARAAGTLVQASVDGCLPPMPFNQIQCADLKGWKGDQQSSGWRKVMDSVTALAGNELGRSVAGGRSQSRQTSICVLPFVNMSGDAEQEYFSDGISEDITTDLSKISALSVTARNTAFQFKGKAVDICRIARDLAVGHVLEGSVRKSGNRVRITAQLIDGASGNHLWAERYDRDLTDIFAIQDEISKAIVDALKLELHRGEKEAIEQRGTTSVEAYNLYLMARNYWITGNHGDPRREERTERICQRAVEIDPDYARAWALMALAQSTLRFGYGRSSDGGLASAGRALSIDPSIAEAHAVLARSLSEEGRMREADAEIETALRLDPESWEVNKEAGRHYMAQRRVEDARRHYEKAVSVMESDYHGWGMLITFYNAQGNHEGVRHAANMMVSQAEKVLEDDPSNGAALGIGANGLAVLGQEERAKEWMERALLLDPDNLNMRYNFACVFAAHLNDREEALKMLELPLARAGGHMIRLVEADPDFETIRDDPRLQKMVADAMARVAMEKATAANQAPSSATPPASAERLRS